MIVMCVALAPAVSRRYKMAYNLNLIMMLQYGGLFKIEKLLQDFSQLEKPSQEISCFHY